VNYERIAPSPRLSPFVAWYWCAESSDATPKKQKIIPDGYPEFVFHYGSPYRIYFQDHWHTQGTALLGGQMQQFFTLENTGPSGIFGITFQPTALTHLFGLDMHKFRDQVVDLQNVFGNGFHLPDKIISAGSTPERVRIAEDHFGQMLHGTSGTHPVDKALSLMRKRYGLISMEEISREISLGNRQLQRLFQQYVGVSPKFYARIIRFNNVFTMIRNGDVTWGDVVHASGYYDQSHFIRNFKAFTGEDPTSYEFKVLTLTNFFAQKANSTKSHLYNTTSSPSR